MKENIVIMNNTDTKDAYYIAEDRRTFLVGCYSYDLEEAEIKRLALASVKGNR